MRIKIDETIFPRLQKYCLVISLVVSLLTFLVYLPALENDFVNWDDQYYVYENQNIWTLNGESLKWMLTAYHASNWHPLTWLSHGIDYAVWGLNPMGHHLTSIVLHGLNTFLVVILITQLVSFGRKDITDHIRISNFEFRDSLLAGAVTGLLFGLHPLHVESVAWVSERKDVLYAFFYLLSILAYVRYAGAEAGKRAVPYVMCLVLFVFSLLSKPMAVSLPVVLLILDVYPFRRLGKEGIFRGKKKVLIEKVPFFALSIVSSILTVQAQGSAGALRSLELYSLYERILVGIQALMFYLYKMVWPVDLAPLYPYPSEASLFDIQYLGIVVLVTGITAFCTWQWRKQKVWAAVWAYYVVTLFPVLGIVQVGEQAAADRYTYLSSLGPFLLAGLGAFKITMKTPDKIYGFLSTMIPVACISVILCGLLSIFTIQQIKTWKDSVTLWNKELNIYPDSTHIAYYNRGKAFEDSKNYGKALNDYEKAIELNPRFPDSFINRGTVLEAIGSHEAAIKSYKKAIALVPDAEDVFYNRGISYGSLGQYQRAIQDLTEAITLNPQYTIAYNNRGVFWGITGDYKRSISDLSRAIQFNPQFVEAYYNRGITYMSMKNYQQAIKDLSLAIRMDAKHAKAYFSRGNVYLKTGDYQMALQDFQEAARLGDGKAQEYLRSRGIQW
jgi:tetratricopeptide (TPR) repeat protein